MVICIFICIFSILKKEKLICALYSLNIFYKKKKKSQNNTWATIIISNNYWVRNKIYIHPSIQQLQNSFSVPSNLYTQKKKKSEIHKKLNKQPPSYLASIPVIGRGAGAGVGTGTSWGVVSNGIVAFVLFFAWAFSIKELIILLDFISLTSSVIKSWQLKENVEKTDQYSS